MREIRMVNNKRFLFQQATTAYTLSVVLFGELLCKWGIINTI